MLVRIVGGHGSTVLHAGQAAQRGIEHPPEARPDASATKPIPQASRSGRMGTSRLSCGRQKTPGTGGRDAPSPLKAVKSAIAHVCPGWSP